jgi:hypothetical protein
VILLSALILGLAAGWGWARWEGRPYRAADLKFLWLVPVALVPQVAVGLLPAKGPLLQGQLATVALPLSLLLFLGFVWLNRSAPGMPVLLLGLLLNLAVISANRGWMPISPETASRLPGGAEAEITASGTRIGPKDILLRPEETRLEVLSDRFLLPEWSPYQAAFSLGDVLVAIGAFWLLAKGRPAEMIDSTE